MKKIKVACFFQLDSRGGTFAHPVREGHEVEDVHELVGAYVRTFAEVGDTEEEILDAIVALRDEWDPQVADLELPEEIYEQAKEQGYLELDSSYDGPGCVLLDREATEVDGYTDDFEFPNWVGVARLRLVPGACGEGDVCQLARQQPDGDWVHPRWDDDAYAFLLILDREAAGLVD